MSSMIKKLNDFQWRVARETCSRNLLTGPGFGYLPCYFNESGKCLEQEDCPLIRNNQDRFGDYVKWIQERCDLWVKNEMNWRKTSGE